MQAGHRFSMRSSTPRPFWLATRPGGYHMVCSVHPYTDLTTCSEQNLCCLCRRGSIQQAVQHAQAALAPWLGRSPEHDAVLTRVAALVAYEHPEVSLGLPASQSLILQPVSLTGNGPTLAAQVASQSKSAPLHQRLVGRLKTIERCMLFCDHSWCLGRTKRGGWKAFTACNKTDLAQAQPTQDLLCLPGFCAGFAAVSAGVPSAPGGGGRRRECRDARHRAGPPLLAPPTAGDLCCSLALVFEVQQEVMVWIS